MTESCRFAQTIGTTVNGISAFLERINGIGNLLLYLDDQDADMDQAEVVLAARNLRMRPAWPPVNMAQISHICKYTFFNTSWLPSEKRRCPIRFRHCTFLARPQRRSSAIHTRRLMRMVAALDRDVRIGPQFAAMHDLDTAVMRSG